MPSPNAAHGVPCALAAVQVHGRTVRFVVMGNVFNTDLQIHRKFDLKVGVGFQPPPAVGPGGWGSVGRRVPSAREGTPGF